MNDPQPEGHMASYIGRRKFLATLGAVAAWPLAARGQQPGQVRRIGILMPYPKSDAKSQSYVRAFRQELARRAFEMVAGPLAVLPINLPIHDLADIERGIASLAEQT